MQKGYKSGKGFNFNLMCCWWGTDQPLKWRYNPPMSISGNSTITKISERIHLSRKLLRQRLLAFTPIHVSNPIQQTLQRIEMLNAYNDGSTSNILQRVLSPLLFVFHPGLGVDHLQNLRLLNPQLLTGE